MSKANSETNARIIIDKLLRESGWTLPGDDGVVNVDTAVTNDAGEADYVLYDSSDFPLCIIEAKKELKSPLEGKEQARKYANALNCRFVVLSNSVSHYFWDIEQGNPNLITVFPSQEELESTKTNFNPSRQETEEIDADYIAKTQFPNFDKHPDYLDEKKRDEFLENNKLRLLRDYQLQAVRIVQSGVAEGQNRFLLEMATGTGKTLTSSAIIKMFLRNYGVKRVLFLVDRLELENQTEEEFDEVLKNDYRTVIWKENKSDWNAADIVVSTVQSFVSRNKYHKVFRPDHFGLVISDEAHRSLGMRSRKVFEYFVGFKLGLTATPRNYLKSINCEDIAESDPRQLEKRLMLDTYNTFCCDSEEPTFRYTLEDGVKDGYLVNPKVFDARTDISTQLLSEKGYLFRYVDEEGNENQGTFKQKDFEKKFFSENTNTTFCEIFFEHAKRDPYTGEIGKTLIFCVSQNHAVKITQILNHIASNVYHKQYNSDFAVQITSNIQNSQDMTVDFRYNSLNGKSKFNPYYRTAKTRVCVTVGMMSTGYNCKDILNICLMRPIYSPSEFIQIKGRGTRRYDFLESWMTKSEIPDHISPQKEEYFLFDFFGNYDYFEKDFDYDEVLKLPSDSSQPVDSSVGRPHIEEAVSTRPDPLATLKKILIPDQGMKVDREFYRSFKNKVVVDTTIRDLVNQQDFAGAETYLKDKILNKPREFFTIEKLRESLGLDRQLTVRELLLHVFDHIEYIPLQQECLDEEFDKFDRVLKLDDSIYSSVREVFDAYVLDTEFRNIIDSKRFAKLSVHPSGEAFNKLSQEFREKIPAYIQQNVNLERFEDVG